MKIALLCAALLIGASIQAEAQASTDKSKVPKMCRTLAVKTAPLVIKRQGYLNILKQSVASSGTHRGNNSSGELKETLGGVQDYMAQSYETAPNLTEKELATLGYSYCMQRLT